MTHFSDYGQHCTDPYCRQKDFLPFTCDLCKKIYCLDHYKYKDHGCPYVNDKRVIVCPICKTSIQLPPNTHTHDNDAIAQLYHKHETSGKCVPQNVPKNNTCPVSGCREQLTTINTYTCKKCSQRVCMSHRYETDHNCVSASRTRVSDTHTRTHTNALGRFGRAISRLVGK
eukprot:GHVR01132450.1.p1 GENE.GHVR01132450.1~~GHVR01132450.1.p1  ORF type:complete len:171 (-),score=39.61 GHVR01132450.1:150-662(-)